MTKLASHQQAAYREKSASATSERTKQQNNASAYQAYLDIIARNMAS